MNISGLLPLSAANACMTVQASAQDLRSSRRSLSYHTVDIGGLKIFFREVGAGSALTVLMLHGFPSSSRMWESLLPLLADKYLSSLRTIQASITAARPLRRTFNTPSTT